MLTYDISNIQIQIIVKFGTANSNTLFIYSYIEIQQLTNYELQYEKNAPSDYESYMKDYISL